MDLPIAVLVGGTGELPLEVWDLGLEFELRAGSGFGDYSHMTSPLKGVCPKSRGY